MRSAVPLAIVLLAILHQDVLCASINRDSVEVVHHRPDCGNHTRPDGSRPDGPRPGCNHTRPNDTRPDHTRPDHTVTDNPHPDHTRPDGTRPDRPHPDCGNHTRPNGTRPDGPRPDCDHTRPDHIRPDHTRPDHTGAVTGSPNPDHTRPDHTRPDHTRPDQSRPDHTRPDHTGAVTGSPHPDHTRPDHTSPDHTRPGRTTPVTESPDLREIDSINEDDKTVDQIIRDAAPTSESFGLEADGAVRVQLDVLFSPEQWAEIMKSEDEPGQYKAITGDRYRWTNKIIPYRFGRGHFSSRQQNLIVQSMRMIESKVCVKFRPYKSSDRNYVYIVDGSGCSSYIGMIGGAQRLTLGNGCVYQSVIIHELGHAIGFYHEQSRTDRDSYVTVYPQNAPSNVRFNFDIASNSNGYGVPYDYGSVMHYGQYAFSANGKRTIVTKDPSWQSRIGTAQTMSSADVQLARILYKC